MLENSKNVNINSVKIDPNASKKERIASYIKQIKNPYCYKDGKTTVKINFSDNEITLEDCLLHYLNGI